MLVKPIGKEEAGKDLCPPVSNNKSTVTSTTFLGIMLITAVQLNSRKAHVLRLHIFKRELSGFGTCTPTV